MKKQELLEINTGKNIIRGILNLMEEPSKEIYICIHGFERCSTTEKKFKSFSDELNILGKNTFRLDFSGCGLSDGDFRFTTISKQSEELGLAIDYLVKNYNFEKFSFFAHSLGACVLAKKLDYIKNKVNKIILLAPALNQKELLRYWFVINSMKGKNIDITWNNFKEYLNEENFLEDCKKDNKLTKFNYINSDYFLEAKDLDFSSFFTDYQDKILHIHGIKDNAVPLESLNIDFKNKLLIEEGDHDIEKANIIGLWIDKIKKFNL